MSTADLAEEYAGWLTSWASATTVRGRRYLIAERLEEWGLDGFTTDTIQTWLGGFSGWSRRTYYNHLRAFTRWAVERGHLDVDPMIGVRRPKQPRSIPRPLTDEEVSRILAAAEGEVRDWILLALLAGLRRHEVAKIRGRDVTPTHLFVEGKGGVRAALPTHPEIWAMAERHDTGEHWFPGTHDGHVSAYAVGVAVGRLFRNLGIEGSIHRCRHTYGTRLLRRGVNIRVVQQLMRHASLATTEAYTAVSDDEMTAAIGLLTA